MALKKTLAILNLSGEFPRELAEYFSSRSIAVINPLNDSTVLDWTHIFCRDAEEFSVIAESYQTNEKDIQIVSLTKVTDLRDFVLSNGKMVFDLPPSFYLNKENMKWKFGGHTLSSFLPSTSAEYEAFNTPTK